MTAVWIALLTLSLVRTAALLQILRQTCDLRSRFDARGKSEKGVTGVRSRLAAQKENWRSKRAVKEIEKYD